jgi:hypothetical protein
MTRGASTRARLAAALSQHGLILRGGFNFAADDDPPPGLSGAPARSVLLIGQAGAAPWPHFRAWLARQPAAIANPLDTWSRNVIGAVAEACGAKAVYPFDKPYLPFQQWAMRAEGLKPSPLGILMHPEYGLWHAWRGALLFEAEAAFPRQATPVHLCDSCAGKPCLRACPVNAYTAGGFAHQACLTHVRGARGDACRDTGCLDRNACPYGTGYRYPAEVQVFHMAAFGR